MKSLALIVWSIAAAAFGEPQLTGLWAARRDFGPSIRGTLRIDHGRADIAGRSATVTIEERRVSFTLPNGEGRFRGTIAGSTITGHWIQSGGASLGNDYATPVTLQKQPDGRWRGAVAPLDDHMTIYLPVVRGADGALITYLRNPERNIGRFTDVQRLTLDGNRIKLLGKENAVLIEGTYDAENDTISLLSLRGGTFDFHRATAADEAAFYPRGKPPAPYVYRKPLVRDDGWPVASVEEVGIDRNALAAFIDMLDAVPIDSVHASDVHAFLLARHGKLVVEEYFHGTIPEEPHDTRSAAKSLTSVLVGASKVPPSTPVYATMGVTTEDARARAITIEHLLTMSSGLDCDDRDPKSPGNEDTMQEQTQQPDWYRYTLDLKMIRRPGEKAVYCSCQPNLAGGVLGRVTAKWLPDLFHELIAVPLQMRQYGMDLMPTGDAYMGGGVRMMPRDFMKLGQVMIDGGRWRGRQIVSAEWAKRSTSEQSVVDGRKYGYLWWLQDYPYKGRMVRAFFAGGNGGQIVMGVPELDLVIAFYGGNYSDAALFIPQREYVPKYVLPAVK